MSNILILNQSQVMSGLGTMTYTIPTTGTYYVQANITEIPPSSLSVVVNDNGGPIYTAPVVSPTQSALQFHFSFQATATHVITVVLSSGAAVDNALNNIKSIISIGEGL